MISYQKFLHEIRIKKSQITQKLRTINELIFQELIIHWVIVNLYLYIPQPLTFIKENIE